MREQLLLRPISLITQIRTKYEQNQEKKNTNRYAYKCKGDGKRTVDEGVYEAATSSTVIAEDLKIHNKGKNNSRRSQNPFLTSSPKIICCLSSC